MSYPTVATSHHHAHGPANRRSRIVRTCAPLFTVLPRDRAKTAVIVLHGACGLTEALERECRRLAAHGHHVVAPLLYYENGGPAFDADDRRAAEAALSRLRVGDLVADIAGAVRHLRSHAAIAPDRIGVVGHGVGGQLAAFGASRFDLAAAVAVDPSTGPWPDLDTVAENGDALGSGWLSLSGDTGLSCQATDFLRSRLLC